MVFIPKCRRKTLYKELRQHLGEVFRKLAEQKESRIEAGHLMLTKEAVDPEATISARTYEYHRLPRHFFALRNSHPS